MKKPLYDEDVKVSKLQKFSNWAFDAKVSQNKPHELFCDTSVGVSTTDCHQQVSSSKRQNKDDDSCTASSSSPTSLISSPTSSTSSEASHAVSAKSVDSREATCQNDNRRSLPQQSRPNVVRSMLEPYWDPPEVGPSDWWKHPPPDHYKGSKWRSTRSSAQY